MIRKKAINNKTIKIQENGTFICKCHFFCVPLQRKTEVLQYLAHDEGICLSGGGKYGHIEKGVY